jgi:TRAP-type mannitol/chloroaromatic compound transport system substrate-binding protein
MPKRDHAINVPCAWVRRSWRTWQNHGGGRRDCEKVLAEFAKAGINVDGLAVQLQGEGAKSFVKSWNELLAVIATKSTALKQAA